ncbi:MAG: O-methyltransferase [Bellilinea sp.]|nr:MAG: O-methyltransferase [Bellilinea sp.]
MALHTPPTPEIEAYITALFAQEDDVLHRIREESAEQGLPQIAVSPEEGAFLALLVRLCKARRILEIGTLAGYSTVWMARALPADGFLVTIEKSSVHAEVARRNFALAGLEGKIRLLVGQASLMLKKAAALAPYDLIFLDADKEGYPQYYEWALQHLPAGGVIAAHNALWGGSVAGEASSPIIEAVRNFNRMVSQDERVSAHLYPAGDGTLIAVKK